MKDFKIAIGSDHGGFRLKEKIIEYLKSNNIEFKDFGTFSEDSCNYPDTAYKVAGEIANSNFGKGILVCGTGVGMSICANKVKGIRAVVCSDTFSAKMSREHNNANVLCIGQRVVGEGLALDLVDIWLKAEFAGGRHKVRVDMIERLTD